MSVITSIRHSLGMALVASLLFSAVACSQESTSETAHTYKILNVMSYHSPWRWTDGQLEGFKKAMSGLKTEYRVFQMNAKNNNSTEALEQMGRDAIALIADWKPDLVYATDDEALEYVVRHFAGSTLPFVFSGVNKTPRDHGLEGAPNVSGVLEEEHFVESLNLLMAIAPGVHRVAVVFDESTMWEPVRRRMKEKISQVPGIEIVSWDTVLTFQEYKHKIAAYPSRADAIALIGIFNFKDEQGKNVPYQQVLKWTAENSRLPDFSFWIDRVNYGTLCAVTVSELEQGMAAGRIARAILAEGRSPASFTPAPTVKGIPAINLARANQLGIRIKSSILLSSEVVQQFEWQR